MGLFQQVSYSSSSTAASAADSSGAADPGPWDLLRSRLPRYNCCCCTGCISALYMRAALCVLRSVVFVQDEPPAVVARVSGELKIQSSREPQFSHMQDRMQPPWVQAYSSTAILCSYYFVLTA